MSAPHHVLGAVVGAALLLSSHRSQASAVLAPAAPNDASNVVLDVAVAVTPFGTTRWSRVTVTASSSVLWLVPARPGAAVDWASDAFLDALDNGGAPRVVPPAGGNAPCASTTAERVPSFGSLAPRSAAGNVALEPTAAAVKSYATGRGFVVSSAMSQQIDSAYAQGYELVAIDIPTSGTAITTPTIRVSDDGAAVLPLALAGGQRSSVRVRANVIAGGAAELATANAIDQTAITWGPTGSNYTLVRENAIFNRLRFVRESASHTFFEGTTVPAGTPIPAVTSALFEGDGRSAGSAITCEASARSATSAPRACAAGAVLRVPGGTACTSGSASSFACGDVDDLAIALSGIQPAKAILTQFSGAISANAMGIDLPIEISQDPAALENPILYAWAFQACGGSSSSSSSSGSATPSQSGAAGSNASRPHHYQHDDGCSGSSTSVVYEDNNEEDLVGSEGCGSASTGQSDSTTNDDQSCGHSSSTSSSSSTDDNSSSSSDDSSSDDSGWDSSDNSDDSSSSSKSDSCGSSSTDSKSSSNRKHHRSSSPVSRYALLFVALLLPLRRGLRVEKL